MAVGLLSLINSLKENKVSEKEEINNFTNEISRSLGFSKDRVEKDINQFRNMPMQNLNLYWIKIKIFMPLSKIINI